MVAVKLEGRLGNQLFQYAFIYATAKKLDTGFYLDKSIEHFIPVKYFKLKTDFLLPLDSSFFSTKGFKRSLRLNKRKSFYAWLQKIIFGNKNITLYNTDPPDEALQRLKNNYMYQGYFQSEKYFESSSADIRKLLVIKKRHVRKFKTLSRNVLSTRKTIVIHIRRGDYIDHSWSLPLSYYKKALDLADYENANCVFISDEPEFVEKEFSYIKKKYVSNNPEIIDLQFLINADIGILSNSSFSWWGAWLNNKEHKQFFAPKYWLGFKTLQEYPVEIGACMNFNLIEA
ncbi:alpha-1,2-fucosyltransferase [Mucilaginibacter sp. UR6-11]|uniref:alpha-1,2-fucosyltransferase n=1 Tax=Mucilaginibacter sp. UR6-11 TaxID=1435644 RepID=UPI001E3B3B3D|nr:alpha-1,2-fucosyltransferase [Mucilaginibacter sp. UR6-11]MCC8425725.1 alpha-1,2-fucosyltransferase [Mucilaginibacter sp. UR6-11]